MKVGVPVIGQIPKLRHEWMTEENGIWVENTNNMADIIADFILNWLEDNITPTLIDNAKQTAENFASRENFESKVLEVINNIFNVRLSNFEEQLNRIKETNE